MAARGFTAAGEASYWVALVVLLLAACGKPPAEAPAPRSSSLALDEIAQAFWQLELEDSILLQLWQGMETVRLPDLSYEHARRRSDDMRNLLDRLRQIDAEDLDHAEWILLETLRWDLGIYAELADHYWVTFPATPYFMSLAGVHAWFQSAAVETPAGGERYLDLVRQYPDFVDAMCAKLEAQRERGIMLPAPEVDLVLTAWKARLAAPVTVFSAAAPTADIKLTGDAAASFARRLGDLLETEVRPAWARLIDLLSGDYRDMAPRTVGLGQYPGGDAYYRLLIRWDASIDMPPAEIHRIGLEQMAEINARMDDVRRRIGFSGSRADFHRSLRADPRFFAKTPEEVAERLLGYIARIEPKIDEVFSHRPRAPYGVERLSPDLETTSTYGYYQEPTEGNPRGTYFFNGSRLDQRSLIGAQALIYHELIPGHHFQVARVAENEDLADYRRGNWHIGYGEGWSEYASSVLAAEMGMYQDPYDLYGKLAADNFFAARLVVDTGMNAFGWSRERAIELMLENTLESRLQIETETLRYAVDSPAQALAYALGRRTIHRGRERAREALGERFDIRRFHEAVLAYGSMPLAVLERHIDWFIEQESRAGSPP